jgi:hypothetical protein
LKQKDGGEEDKLDGKKKQPGPGVQNPRVPDSGMNGE